MAFPAKTTIIIFKTIKSPTDYVLITDSFNRLLEEGLHYEIVYRSILNERWMLYNESQGPTKLD